VTNDYAPVNAYYMTFQLLFVSRRGKETGYFYGADNRKKRTWASVISPAFQNAYPVLEDSLCFPLSCQSDKEG
jgi:hypothetical protein